MGIEILLGVLVFPIAQKVGEKWIDRIATGIDSYSVDLLKQVIYDPTKEQEVKDYFRDNPTVAEKVEQNVANAMQSADIAASIATAVVPSSGDILKYYAALINWIVQYGSKLGRHFVLKGFLNGEFCISYFIFDPDPNKVGNYAVAEVVEGRSILGRSSNYIMITSSQVRGEGLYVEKLKSAEARDKKFAEMNRKARLSYNGSLDSGDYRYNNLVTKIYPHYVWYERPGKFDISELSSKQQEELEITRIKEPVQAMIQGLWELFEYESAFLKELRSAIEGVES